MQSWKKKRNVWLSREGCSFMKCFGTAVKSHYFALKNLPEWRLQAAWCNMLTLKQIISYDSLTHWHPCQRCSSPSCCSSSVSCPVQTGQVSSCKRRLGRQPKYARSNTTPAGCAVLVEGSLPTVH